MRYLRTLAVTWLSACSLVAIAGQPQAAAPAAEPEKFFTEQVRPILEKRCWECHGQDVQESSLRLDSQQGLTAGGSSGRSLTNVAQPDESYLWEVLQHGGSVAMPPDDKLPDSELTVLHEWIKLGLPWPGASSPSAVPATREERYALQRQQHWALQKISDPALPPVQNAQWVAQPLDYYILARLESHGLTPSLPADRRTLIRRLKFDLLGLPPTIDEVQAFVNDTSADAYEKLVERYLASPHYGERWGRHWLDVARYADTRGYAFDRERRYPYAYTYRDYVIRAFNEDLPYDQFILQQLAADQLCSEPNDPNLAALGFLTVGRKFNNRHLDIDDQIDAVGRGVLGLTISCARCHDHKYDPIPTEDYYSLYGVFASSKEPDEFPIIGDPTQTPGYAEFKQELDRRQAELDNFVETKRDEIAQAARRHAADYLARAITRESEESLILQPFIGLKGEEFKPRLVQRWREQLVRTAKADHPVLGPLYELALIPDEEYTTKAPTVLERWQAVVTGTEPGQLNPHVKEALQREPPHTKLDLARVYGQLLSSLYLQQQEASPAATESPSAAATAAAPFDTATVQVVEILTGPSGLTDIALSETRSLLTRADGNTYRELERKVQSFQVDSPGSPPRAMVIREDDKPHNPHVFIRGDHARPGKEVPRQFLLALAGFERKPFEQGSGRLELARLIASPDNPLTARVIANRIWMHHFSMPLVSTPSDFGTRSDPPVQADLLDHLATCLIQHKWSLKSLHRTILSSSTYRQASLTRAECAAVDPENMLYWRMNPHRLEFEPMRDAMLAVASQLDLTSGGRPAELTKEPFSLRRAVYGYIDRQDLPGLFRVFDVASPDQSCPARSRTTVPQQALFVMNSPFAMECAKQVVARTEIVSVAEVHPRIEAIYRLVFARSPSAEELRVGEEFIAAASQETAPEGHPDAWQQYAQLLLMSNAFLFVD